MADFKQFCEIYQKFLSTDQISEKLMLNDRLKFISKNIIQNIHDSFEFYIHIKDQLDICETTYTEFIFEIIEKCYTIFKKNETKTTISLNSYVYKDIENLLNLLWNNKYKSYDTVDKILILLKKLLKFKKLMYPSNSNINDELGSTMKDIKFLINLINKKFISDLDGLSVKSKALLLLESCRIDTNNMSFYNEFIVFINCLLDSLINNTINIEKNKFLLIEEIEFFLSIIKKNNTKS